ncbi:MAG: hypothetical protein JO112_06315, partial [Planctomycetes bacterium]|nr:hypothetical protein [Planctomycetota bacterium]
MRPPPFLQWMESVTRLLRGRADPSPAEPTWGPSYLILPGPARPPYHGPFSDCARWLLQRATLLAEATCGPTHFLTADPRSGDVRSFPDGTNRRLASLFEGQRHILMLNLSFLLRPPALLPRLRRAAEEGQLALLISPDGRTLEAAAAAQRHARRAEWRRAVAQLASTQVPSDEAHLRG